MFPAKYINFQRGKIQLRDPSLHTYSKCKTTADGSKTIYSCVERLKESKCTSMATVMEANQMIIKVTPHNHFVDAGKLIAKATAQEAIKNAIANPDIKARNVLLNVAKDLDEAGPNVLVHMPKRSTLTRKIRKTTSKFKPCSLSIKCSERGKGCL